MKSFDEIVDYVIKRKFYTGDDYHSGLIYEKDGKVVYGFTVDIYKITDYSYIHIGEKNIK